MSPRLRLFTLAVLACLSVTAGTGQLGAAGGPPASSPERPLVVGWHDEMNDIRAWTPLSPQNAPEVFSLQKGTLGLLLGRQTVAAQQAYPFSWASVYRMAAVDLDEYPILAVRAVRLSKDAWWDVILQEYGDGVVVGKETKTPSLDRAGLILFDVPAQTGLTGRKDIRLRLNVAGLHEGGAVEYAWIRFIRRADVERLRRHPDCQDVRIRVSGLR